MLPARVAEAGFMGNLNDLENVFRDAVFTVLFRAPEVFAKARPVLDRKGIPCCFYGSDAYASMLEGAHVMLYREARIADMVLDRLTREVGQGHGRPVATLHVQSVDNQIHTESMACPTTTIDIPVFQDGRLLLERMLLQAREGGAPFRLEREDTLVARESG